MGKTTVIREIARVLSDELHKRVVIVDTSNEIGGDGDVPHPAIGSARRMQVTFQEHSRHLPGSFQAASPPSVFWVFWGFLGFHLGFLGFSGFSGFFGFFLGFLFVVFCLPRSFPV